MPKLGQLVRGAASTNAKDYLHLLAKWKNCLIIAAVRDQIGGGYDDEMDKAWKSLGFDTCLKGNSWRGYIGIADDRRSVYEQLSAMDENVKCEQTIGSINIQVKSGSFWGDNIAEIKINGINYAFNGRGLNIVVYDKSRQEVVDSSCIDTHPKNLLLRHKEIDFIEKNWKKVNLHKTIRIIGAIERGDKTEAERCIKSWIVKKTGPDTSSALNSKHQRWKDCRERLALTELFPLSYKQKIKIRLVFDYGFFFWNCVESLLKAFVGDDRFQVAVVFLQENAYQAGKQTAENMGINCWYWPEYSIARDLPDITIISMIGSVDPAKRKQYYECGHFSKMFFALPYSISPYSTGGFFSGWSLAGSSALFAPRLAHMSMDYCFWDSMIYDNLSAGGYDISHCVKMGNPKFDAIYNKLHKEYATPAGWEKFQGKKVFLWAFDHDYDTDNFTFDQYAKAVFAYFDNHPDAGLIFRHHPGVLGASYWSFSDMDWLEDYMKRSPNMIWDKNPDYSISYDIADAIITDVACGVTVSALSTKKPLCVFFRMGAQKIIKYPGLIENLYQVQSEQEAVDFFEMIQRGEDPMKEQREKAFHECILHFDGKNGQRMKDFIVEKYFEKCGSLMKEPGGG